jgi:hypothetical protein
VFIAEKTGDAGYEPCKSQSGAYIKWEIYIIDIYSYPTIQYGAHRTRIKLN